MTDSTALVELEKRLADLQMLESRLVAGVVIEQRYLIAWVFDLLVLPSADKYTCRRFRALLDAEAWESAALALAFRVLTPLGFLSWGIDGTQKDYNVGWVAVNADGGLLEGRGESPTPALALLLALVRALQSQSKREAGDAIS